MVSNKPKMPKINLNPKIDFQIDTKKTLLEQGFLTFINVEVLEITLGPYSQNSHKYLLK